MRDRKRIAAVLTAVALAVGVQAFAAQQATKEQVPGITNLSRLETTVACAGAIEPEKAVPEIQKMGYKSIINLREATETGADVEKEAAIARAAGLQYFHVPFNGRTPDTKAADQFVAAITTAGAEPAFIHCASGNRAATMWMIKRMVVDGWDAERATKEAAALGQTSEPLRQFAVTYAQSRKR